MVEPQPSKLITRVRFPSPAPFENKSGPATYVTGPGIFFHADFISMFRHVSFARKGLLSGFFVFSHTNKKVSLKHLARIKDSCGIESGFEAAHQGDRHFSVLPEKIFLLGVTHPVLS